MAIGDNDISFELLSPHAYILTAGRSAAAPNDGMSVILSGSSTVIVSASVPGTHTGVLQPGKYRIKAGATSASGAFANPDLTVVIEPPGNSMVTFALALSPQP